MRGGHGSMGIWAVLGVPSRADSMAVKPLLRSLIQPRGWTGPRSPSLPFSVLGKEEFVAGLCQRAWHALPSGHMMQLFRNRCRDVSGAHKQQTSQSYDWHRQHVSRLQTLPPEMQKTTNKITSTQTYKKTLTGKLHPSWGCPRPEIKDLQPNNTTVQPEERVSMAVSGPRTGESPCRFAMGKLGFSPKSAAWASSAATKDQAAAQWGDPSCMNHCSEGWASHPYGGHLLSLAVDWFRFWFSSDTWFSMAQTRRDGSFPFFPLNPSFYGELAFLSLLVFNQIGIFWSQFDNLSWHGSRIFAGLFRRGSYKWYELIMWCKFTLHVTNFRLMCFQQSKHSKFHRQIAVFSLAGPPM